MEKVWQDFEKWWVDTRADEIPLTKKGIAAVAFEAGLKSAQQSVQPTGGESAPLRALSTPEVDSIEQADTTPPTIG